MFIVPPHLLLSALRLLLASEHVSCHLPALDAIPATTTTMDSSLSEINPSLALVFDHSNRKETNSSRMPMVLETHRWSVRMRLDSLQHCSSQDVLELEGSG